MWFIRAAAAVPMNRDEATEPARDWSSPVAWIARIGWGVALLAVLSATNRLRQEFTRLLFEQGESGAVDLAVFLPTVQGWVSGVRPR